MPAAFRKPIPVLLLLLADMPGEPASAAEDEQAVPEKNVFGLGVGAAIVRFDTKYKTTNKDSGFSLFIDPEGNLGLPMVSHVNTFYGGYHFARKHYVGFAHFGVNRESVVFDQQFNLDDIVIVDGKITIRDKTNFFNLSYGYSIFRDERSEILALFGLNGMEFKYTLEASGQVTIGDSITSNTYEEEASVFAPLPLFGFDFNYAFTPRWSLSTKISLIGGSYEEVSAAILSTRVNTIYQFTKHVGASIGISYFNAEVTIDNEKRRHEISYGYDGAYIGVHFKY